MNPGDFRHPVEVQTYTEALDSHGGQNGTWATTSTIWASVETLTGRKLEMARQIDIAATVELRTRYCGSGGVSGLTHANRLVYNNRILEIIIIVNEHERNIVNKIVCKEQIDV